MCSDFEDVRRLHFMAFDKLRSELLRHGVRLWKALDEGESLRLLSKEKEVELMHWRHEVLWRSNYESYLMEQATFCSMRFALLTFKINPFFYPSCRKRRSLWSTLRAKPTELGVHVVN